MSFYVDLESPPLPRAARGLPQPAQKASFAHGKAASAAASRAPSRGTFISKASPRCVAWNAYPACRFSGRLLQRVWPIQLGQLQL